MHAPDRAWLTLVITAVAGCGGAQAGASVASPAAADTPTVLVVPADLAAEADQAARSHGLGLAVAAPDEAPSAIDRARTVMRDAWARYVQLAFAESLELVREAEVAVEQAARTRADFELLAEVRVLGGMDEQALGHDEAARESMRSAARLRPEWQLDEGRYPPPVRELHEALRAEVRAEPAASITITTSPGGAGVTVDGIDVGVSPTTAHGTSGRHVVGVTLPGHAPASLVADLRADGGEPLAIELRPADPAAAARQLLSVAEGEALPPSSTDALARVFQAGRAVAVTRTEGGLRAVVFDLSTGASRTMLASDWSTALAFAGQPAADLAVSSGQEAPGEEHRGFLFRAATGFGLLAAPFTDPMVKAEAGGFSLQLELAVGGSLAPGFVLGGYLGFAGIPSPAITVDSMDVADDVSLDVVGTLGVLADWYVDPTAGFHLQLGLAGSATGADSQSGTVAKHTARGGALILGVGYDWWISGDWALGALFRATGGAAQGEGYTHNFVNLALLMSAAYY